MPLGIPLVPRRYGFTMMTLGWLAVIVMGEAWCRFLGITPDGVFF